MATILSKQLLSTTTAVGAKMLRSVPLLFKDSYSTYLKSNINKQKFLIGLKISEQQSLAASNQSRLQNQQNEPLVVLPVNYLNDPSANDDTVSKAAREIHARTEKKANEETNFAVSTPLSDPAASKQEQEQQFVSSRAKIQFNRQQIRNCSSFSSTDKQDLIQAFMIYSETQGDDKPCNENNNNFDESKIALELNDRIKEQLESLSISGMNLNFVMDVIDVHGAIENSANHNINNLTTDNIENDMTVHQLPIEMEAKITGTIDLCPIKMKEKGLDQLTSQELNSRISNVASNICLLALENGMRNRDRNLECDEQENELPTYNEDPSR